MKIEPKINQRGLKPCWCSNLSYDLLIKDSRRNFKIMRCQKCGLVRTFPVPDFSEKRYNQYSMDSYRKNKKILKGFMRQIINLILKYKKSGRLLEVGCGAGYFLAMAAPRFELFGVEMSKEGVEMIKEKVGGMVKNCSLSEANFPSDFFDVIVLNHTLEHIADLAGFLIEVKRVINKNGILVLGLPNFGGLFSKLRKNRWPGLQPKEHVWQFEPKSIAKLLNDYGFVVISSQKKSSHNWRSILNRRNASLRLFLLKIINWIFGLIGFGDNMLIVAKIK